MDASAELRLSLVLWAAVAAIIIWARWRNQTAGVGLVLTYVVLLSMNHWLCTLLYVLPWYRPAYASNFVAAGFRQALYGLLSFAVASLVLWPWLRRWGPLRRLGVGHKRAEDGEVAPRFSGIYILLGLAGYFVVAPITAGVPTLSAITGSLGNLLVVGLTLACAQAWQTHRRGLLAALLLMAAVWPLVTVGSQGFLGAGFASLVILLAFVVQLIGFRGRVFLIALIVFYLGLSIYVTYMQNREDIRSVVWSEDSTAAQRAAVVYASARDFQWFNPLSEAHLFWIDVRMNQNFLIGSAAYRVESGLHDYAKGETLIDVFIMLVPRALWPSKPLRVGGSARVTQYTGIPFASSTSVGVGQVMEFYINFGTIGVVLGFVLFGCLLAALDEIAARCLQQGDWRSFALWYLPVLSLLRPDNDLFVIVAGFVSSLVAVLVINRFAVPVLLLRRPSARWRAPGGKGTILDRPP